jgi:hypothetical protein
MMTMEPSRPLAGTDWLKERRCAGWQPAAGLAPQERRLAKDERLFEGINNLGSGLAAAGLLIN